VIVIQEAAAALPFSPEQAFDIAADIERYPEFLNGWLAARIQRRDSNTCYVVQSLGIGPLRLQFGSQAVLNRPERIEVTSVEPPFRRFSLTWSITALPPGCRVSVAAEVEMLSGFHQHVVNRLLPAAVDDIIGAFEARAHALYGTA
jgi:coenzyme Q-binding protein COQ10